jgi:predicted metal-dependent hydrolase
MRLATRMEQQRLLFDEPAVFTPRISEADASPHDPAVVENTQSIDLPQQQSHVEAAVEFVRHPRARRYLIRVRGDGSVRVTIPRRGSRREATAFYEQQREWIRQQQERVAKVRDRLPADLPDDARRELQARARRELPERLLQLAGDAGVSVRKVSVRNQKHRWGSCSPSGLICLNWRLITMPPWVRDYVLYHELMHLKRMDHSAAFWKLVAEVCPDYKRARRWLRRHALAPHAPDAHAESDAEPSSSAAGDGAHGEAAVG